MEDLRTWHSTSQTNVAPTTTVCYLLSLANCRCPLHSIPLSLSLPPTCRHSSKVGRLANFEVVAEAIEERPLLHELRCLAKLTSLEEYSYSDRDHGDRICFEWVTFRVGLVELYLHSQTSHLLPTQIVRVVYSKSCPPFIGLRTLPLLQGTEQRVVSATSELLAPFYFTWETNIINHLQSFRTYDAISQSTRA